MSLPLPLSPGATALPVADRLTPRRPWQPLSDEEWLALMPYVLRRSGPGRPIPELRARMDAIFHVADARLPWHALPPEYGKPDTASRYCRRLTHAGLWQRLLEALAEAPPRHPLRRIEAWIVRACKRVHRILGLGFLVLIRRIGLRSALHAPPWLLPDPDLSETVLRWQIRLPDRLTRRACRPLRERIRAMLRLLRVAAGRRRIPRSVQHGWP